MTEDGTGVALVKGPQPEAEDSVIRPCDKVETDDDSRPERPIYLRFRFAKGAPEENPPAGTPADEAHARAIAVSVVQQVRQLVPKGPFNNRGPQPEAGVAIADSAIKPGQLPPEILARSQYPRAEDLYGDGVVDKGLDKPGDFCRVGPTEMERVPVDNTLTRMALMEATTRRIGGGVCEKFSLLALGILSTTAPAGTVACKIQHSIDHHFIIVRVGTSQWWVIDPWVHTAFVIPWEDCTFDKTGVVAHVEMTVHAPVQEPFGILLEGDKIDRTYREIKQNNSPNPRTDTKFQKNWSHAHNLGMFANLSSLPQQVIEDAVRINDAWRLAAGPRHWGP